MIARLVKSDYIIEGIEFELWIETGLREPNFWLMFGGIEQDLERFTEKQLQEISQYVDDWRAPNV